MDLALSREFNRQGQGNRAIPTNMYTLYDPDLMQCIFRANKMADAWITNVDTGVSTDVSCVYPHVGPSGIHI